MTVPFTPAPDDATPTDLAAWPETRVSAAVPQPEEGEKAAHASFCDSSGFRTLLAARQIAADRGTEFRVVIPPGAAVLRTLKTMGLNQVLSIHSSLPDAMADSGR